MKSIMASVCMVLALATGIASFWLHMKSALGQVLLASAWESAVETQQIRRAWPWADTWPVAHLSVPASNQSLVVLDGVSGEAMAFGPGRVTTSSSTASSGTFIVGGHRDSHLKFLQDVSTGQVMDLQTADGEKTRFRVAEQFIANADDGPLNLPADLHALVLVTCYPFNALQTGGPLRYVVVALPEEDA